VGFDQIGLKLVGGALDQSQYLVNPVAAMPSLHMAYATLAAGFFWFGKPWWGKVLLALYPTAMAISLVYGGEHYVIDEIAGVAFALTIIATWRYLRARRLRSTAVPV
jgi:membrane-associated phospholipid phosphatase